MKANLEKTGKAAPSDISNVVSHVLHNRQRFDKLMDTKSVIAEIFVGCFPICAKCCFRARDTNGTLEWKKKNLYYNGARRFYDEMDLVKILKALRLSKLIAQSVFKQEDRILLQL